MSKANKKGEKMMEPPNLLVCGFEKLKILKGYLETSFLVKLKHFTRIYYVGIGYIRACTACMTVNLASCAYDRVTNQIKRVIAACG